MEFRFSPSHLINPSFDQEGEEMVVGGGAGEPVDR